MSLWKTPEHLWNVRLEENLFASKNFALTKEKEKESAFFSSQSQVLSSRFLRSLRTLRLKALLSLRIAAMAAVMYRLA